MHTYIAADAVSQEVFLYASSLHIVLSTYAAVTLRCTCRYLPAVGLRLCRISVQHDFYISRPQNEHNLRIRTFIDQELFAAGQF
jgi:hypothetical protein